MTTKLRQHKFESSGVTVAIETIRRSLLVDLMRQYPEPKAPIVELERPDGSKMPAFDTVNEVYKNEYEKWSVDIERRIRILYIVTCVKHALTDDERAQVAQYREVVREAGVQLETNDLVVFISHIAITNDDDYRSFLNACKGVPSDPKLTNGLIPSTLESMA